MLKLNYTDCGLFLEQVDASLVALAKPSLWEFATQRVMLAVYTGEPLHMEPGRAAFLVSANAPEVKKLQSILQADTTQTVTVASVEDGFVEVSLKGTWIAKSINAEAGTLIAALSDESEKLVCQLWQLTQCQSVFVA
ncbi:MAG: hypothetical protein HC800_19210 [Phormidesmis sp. RL_2_1]|nr:hypothetical protein [Phormidesmis sp. RL_2_1]